MSKIGSSEQSFAYQVAKKCKSLNLYISNNDNR